MLIMAGLLEIGGRSIQTGKTFGVLGQREEGFKTANLMLAGHLRLATLTNMSIKKSQILTKTESGFGGG